MVNEYDDPGCRQASVLKLGNFVPRSEVNGPGTRAVVWVQGCPHRCEGCFNPQFQPFSPAWQITADEIADAILGLQGISGVTFSGGEPFAQAAALASVGTRVQDAGLSVITYSGYEYPRLAQGAGPGWQDLLAVTDLLIAGPYVASLWCKGGLKGSENQDIIPLSGRIAVPPAGKVGRSRPAEFTIAGDGTIIATGFPDMAFLRHLDSRCREA